MTRLVDLVRSHPWTTGYITCVVVVAAIVERVTYPEGGDAGPALEGRMPGLVSPGRARERRD